MKPKPKPTQSKRRYNVSSETIKRESDACRIRVSKRRKLKCYAKQPGDEFDCDVWEAGEGPHCQSVCIMKDACDPKRRKLAKAIADMLFTNCDVPHRFYDVVIKSIEQLLKKHGI